MRCFAVPVCLSVVLLSGAIYAQSGGCELAGAATLPAGALLYSGREGDASLARFTGRALPLTVRDFGAARVAVTTGDGRDGVRAVGYVPRDLVTIFTTREVPLRPPHLWLNPGEVVEVAGAEAGRLRLRKVLLGPLQGSLDAWAPCEAVGLERRAAVRRALPASGWAFSPAVSTISLFDEPTATAREIVRFGVEPELVLLVTVDQGRFVRVHYSGAVGVDAWARTEDLRRSQVPPQAPAPSWQAPQPALELFVPEGAQKRVTSERVALRFEPDGPVIAELEPATSVVVLEVTDAWARVLPERLELAPPEGRSFWAARASLGL